MKSKLIGFVFVIAIASTSVLLKSGVLAQSAPSGQTGGAKSASEKTVGETYKNIQVLTDFKNAPANELIGTMQFMSGSLAVSCNYCHVAESGPFESDANRTKLKAREMIKMMRVINEANFGGRQEVTCNTCHRGSPQPIGTPRPWYKSAEQVAAYLKARPLPTPGNPSAAGATSSPPAEAATVLPDVEQVMGNYRKAVGANGVKSIRISATSAAALGVAPVPLEVIAVFPDKFLLTSIARGIENKSILNGDRGWRVTPQGSTPLPAAALQGFMGRIAPLIFPVKYEKPTAPRKVTGLEKIGDKTYYVVESHTATESQRLYFDVQTGLLFKARNEVTTWFGSKVEETTFEDYRDLNGVKMPHLITNHFMEDQQIFKIAEIQTNIDVDPARFEPPAAKTP